MTGTLTARTAADESAALRRARSLTGARLADPHIAPVVIGPPGDSPGAWAGAPSALLRDGTFYLAYRLRRPIGQGRGYANVVARSTDGVTFEPVAVLARDAFGGESLERPALTVSRDGRWRLYVSVATPGTKHWRVDLVEAASPEQLAVGSVQTVLPGSPDIAVKDPVVLFAAGRWHLWASCHPLTDPAHTDRMTTEYATSPDGVRWSWHGTALSGRPGRWDERGTRISAVVLDGDGDHGDGDHGDDAGHGNPVAYYDGRRTAEENWEERTGLAGAGRTFGTFEAVGHEPLAASPHGAGGLRYLSVVPLPAGGRRLYYEITRADGAHELRTTVQPDE